MGFGESFPNQTRRRAATVPHLDRDGLLAADVASPSAF